MTHHDHDHPARAGRTNVVSAVFHDVEDAEEAYNEASARGYTDNEISVLMSEQARDRWFPSERFGEVERESKTLEGTGVGGAVGAALGAIAGAILAAGTIVAIPPLGLIVAGPLAAGLAGAGAGSITGGLIGALVGAGIKEDRAKVYQTAIEKGGIVVAVHPHSEKDAEELAAAWDDCGGEEVYRG